jgi:hypothetical protein
MVKRKEEKLTPGGIGCMIVLSLLGILFAYLFIEIMTTW